ncbi:hypothetical protein MASR2M16_32980 [Thauera terpenica]
MADPRLVRVAWAYPASLVVPVAGLGVLMLAWPAGFGVGWAMLMGLAGLVGWTLIEYLLHRFMLHRVEPFRAWHVEHHRHADRPDPRAPQLQHCAGAEHDGAARACYRGSTAGLCRLLWAC